MASGLEIFQVTKSFRVPGQEPVLALRSLTLTVSENEIVSLIGPSGCGKSTLLDIVSGLALPDEGKVLLDGQIITGQRKHVSYMPQKDVLFPWRTILDNVIVGLEVQGVNKAKAREEARQLLPVFGLEDFAASFPAALSGGMRQRAALLRTYLCRKSLILLDEPFGKLDAITRMQMQKWLLDLWQKLKRTILFVTHDVDEAILLSDRIYVLSPRPGQLVAELRVDFPRPREISLAGGPGFASLKSEILRLLGESGFGEEFSNV